MPQEKEDAIRGMLEAYAKGDNEGGLAAFDPAAAFHWTFRPDGGVFHGHEGVAEAMRSWTAPFAEHRIELTEVRDAGRIVHWQGFAGRDDALVAAGLSEDPCRPSAND
jgi:hypothetical protein